MNINELTAVVVDLCIKSNLRLAPAVLKEFMKRFYIMN